MKLALTSQINDIGMSAFIVYQIQLTAVPKQSDKKMMDNNSNNVIQTNRTHEITTVVLDVRAAQSLDLGAVFCRSLFAFLSLFVLSFVLHVLLRITLLVTPLIISHLKVVSSNHDHGEGPLDNTLYGKVFQTVATDRWYAVKHAVCCCVS
jgi:hypothetical protein